MEISTVQSMDINLTTAQPPATNFSTNVTIWNPPLDFDDNNPFKFVYIQVIFGILYGIVFLGCIIGNALVLFVIIRHRHMRNITNFFLANLAVADFCVGVFCVIPNLMSYFTQHWFAGQVMCKLYFFIQCVSYTVSIIILTVISMERYFAIIHPMTSRRLSRMTLMRIIIVLVWAVAIIYSIPILIAYKTVGIDEDGTMSYFCVNLSSQYLKPMVLINFILWYCIPLALMILLYSRVSVVLWKSSFMVTSGGVAKKRFTSSSAASSHETESASTEKKKKALTRQSTGDTETTLVSPGPQQAHMTKYFDQSHLSAEQPMTKSETVSSNISMHSENYAKQAKGVSGVVASRRKVIRLLIVLIISFAVCLLPHHIRLMYELLGTHNYHPSFLQRLVPPTTFLCFYTNSCLNPLLYAFFSENFRKSFKEVIWRKKSSALRQQQQLYSHSKSAVTKTMNYKETQASALPSD